MKLVYNKNLEEIVTDENNQEVIIYNIIVQKDVRIESDSYSLLESEKLLTKIEYIIECKKINLIDYNDLRKYLIINLLPSWNELTDSERSLMVSYYIVPNEYVWDSNQSKIYKMLVDNATKCRESRVDIGRSYVSLFYINDVQKSMNFFIDTELLMNQYIKGKIPALQAFVNDSIILDYDYTTNGFSTKSYYSEELKTQLNYILFR